MNIEHFLGQLLIIGFKGAEITENSLFIEDIEQRHLGGVILFDRFLAAKQPENNIISPDQVRHLILQLQEKAEIPLLVAVDQEGGKVSRFKAERGFGETAAAAELGSTATTEKTITAAEQTGAMLADLGFNLNLAPVVDLDRNPDNPIIGRYRRSFSIDPLQVATHAAAWITAHRRHGILSCLKHFPGHGSALADSHLGFVDISTTWKNDELIPYRELLKRGLVDSVMTGHLYNRNIDPDFPATLSAATISGLLRGELGYDGPIISDDMQMRAITHHFGFDEGIIRALNAGVDLLIFGNNLDYDPAICKRAVKVILNGLRRKTISEEQIAQALSRVESLKRSLQVSHRAPEENECGKHED